MGFRFRYQLEIVLYNDGRMNSIRVDCPLRIAVGICSRVCVYVYLSVSLINFPLTHDCLAE